MIDNATLSKIAKLYYLEGMTQKQIGDSLGISRIGISRALKKCLDTGIVEIKIREFTPLSDLEKQLSEKYPNVKFRLVPFSDDHHTLIKNLADGAGAELDRIVRASDNIGIGWGYTMSNIEISSENKYPEKTFVSLLGGYGNVSIEMHSNHITDKIAHEYGANTMRLLTPSVVDDARFREIIINESSIKQVFDMYKKLDCLICSVGDPSDDLATIHRSGYFGKEALKELSDKDICCDIVSSVFIDRDGNMRHLDLSDRIIGIAPEDFLRVKEKVIVAGGEEKMFALYLALGNGFIDTLVTDENTARYLLEK